MANLTGGFRFISLGKNMVLSTKLPDNKPGRKDGDRPETKVEIDGPNLGNDYLGSNSVTNSLPSRLCSTQDSRIPNDFLLVG